MTSRALEGAGRYKHYAYNARKLEWRINRLTYASFEKVEKQVLVGIFVNARDYIASCLMTPIQ